MRFKKMTLTIPQKLYMNAMRLIEAGYFASFSDLVRAGLRSELRNFSQLRDASNWIDDMSVHIRGSGKSDEEIISGLRRTRQHIWERKYAGRFGQ